MRRLAANYLFTNNGDPIRNGCVEIHEDGTLLSVGALEKELSSTEFHNGILCPELTGIDSRNIGQLLPGMPVASVLERYCNARMKSGTHCGIILVNNIDFENMRLTENSQSKRLL